MTITRLAGVAGRRASSAARAYSSAAAVSWIEHGPTTTTSRGSAPAMTLAIASARVGDDVRGALADRDLLEQDGRRNERPDVPDAKVVGASKHGIIAASK